MNIIYQNLNGSGIMASIEYALSNYVIVTARANGIHIKLSSPNDSPIDMTPDLARNLRDALNKSEDIVGEFETTPLTILYLKHGI